MKPSRSVAKKYKLVEGMVLGKIDPKRVKDPKEAIRAISRDNLKSVIVANIGPKMTPEVFHEFKVPFRSSAKRQAFFRFLDMCTDAWFEANRP